MKLHSYASEGIILARRNFGEADRIISIYSKDRGRISLIAKGVRKPESRKRGHLEIFNHLKFNATIGRGIDVMTEAELIDDFKEVRKNLKRVSLAYYICEVTGKITHELEQNERLFSLLYENLNKLKEEVELKKLRLNFLTDLLTLLGYWPESQVLADPDKKLEEVIERQVASYRVGKILSS